MMREKARKILLAHVTGEESTVGFCQINDDQPVQNMAEIWIDIEGQQRLRKGFVVH